MSKIEGPQVMAAILAVAAIAVVVAFVAPDFLDKIADAAIVGIVALGMKLLDKNGDK